MHPFVLGAVAYDPKVVTIWDGFKLFFEERGLPFDYVLFHNYERQVAAHFAGVIDVAWNSPLAWIQADRIAKRLGREATAVAMRDTDQDLTSVVVVRADDSVRAPLDLRGRRIGVGAEDSPQATLLPLGSLRAAGLDLTSVQVVQHDLLLGKHGDHVGGERVAAQALIAGGVDAACMIDSNLLAFTADGTLPAGSTRVIHTTAPYDHCNFTSLGDPHEERLLRFVSLLMGMSWDDPAVRRLMDLEGLRAWRPGRTHGYAQLEAACTAFGTIDAFVASVG
jgi:phosphonate transport system substrate-binding protein